jgi:signal transduction histidine kinase
MQLTSGWTRRLVANLCIKHPVLAAVLLFFLMFTLSNYVSVTTRFDLVLSPFWNMVVEGAVMAFFAAAPLYEVCRLNRQLTELDTVRTIVTTLHHEINNPLQVILLSADRLHLIERYDAECVEDIAANGTRIRDVVLKLSGLEAGVRLHTEPGFRGLIDIARSR